MKSIASFLTANYRAIVEAFTATGGPIVLEVMLGSIIGAFGMALIFSPTPVIALLSGYAGFRLVSSSDDAWGAAFVVIFVLKLWVLKPLWLRIVSSGVIVFVFVSWFVNFYIYSRPGAFYWVFLLFAGWALVCQGMLFNELRERS